MTIISCSLIKEKAKFEWKSYPSSRKESFRNFGKDLRREKSFVQRNCLSSDFHSMIPIFFIDCLFKFWKFGWFSYLWNFISFWTYQDPTPKSVSLLEPSSSWLDVEIHYYSSSSFVDFSWNNVNSFFFMLKEVMSKFSFG